MDVAPELITIVNELYKKFAKDDEKLNRIIKAISEGKGDYGKGSELAVRMGNDLARAYKHAISSNVLPGGKMYYNIAKRIIEETLAPSEELLADYLEEVQESMNKAAGLGLKAVRPEMNKDRLDGLIERLSGADNYDDVAWILGEPVINVHQSVVDDFVQENAKAHYDAGLRPKIVRKLGGRACDWCRGLAGTYDYGEVRYYGSDVFRRHERCRCTVEYVEGKYSQNVWTKMEAVRQEQSVSKTEKKVQYRDVTKEYQRTRTPGLGKIEYDEGYQKETHKDEIEMAEWIHNHLGGDIRLLNESKEDGVKTPDYMWNGKMWDLKTVTTEKSANSAIRGGMKQIEKNPGGIILNYGENDIDAELATQILDKRYKSSGNGMHIDVVIIKREKIERAIRY